MNFDKNWPNIMLAKFNLIWQLLVKIQSKRFIMLIRFLLLMVHVFVILVDLEKMLRIIEKIYHIISLQ